LAVVKAILRYFSYLFHAVLALFLLAVSVLTLASGSHNLHLGMFPWTGSTLTYVLLGASLFGLISLLLAIAGKLRFLFLLWSMAVAVMLVKGYFLSGYRFAPGEASRALYIALGSLVAAVGAVFQAGSRSPSKRY
jgi:hypothetical protein